MYCHRCGKELPEGAAYCANCGARVGEYTPADYWWGWWGWERERWHRREWDPMDAVWGAIRGVGFLVIIGLTVIRYPDVFTLAIRYLESWGAYDYPVLPPHALGQVIIFFLTACGVWGLVSGGIRLAFSRKMRRPLREIVGALFTLFVAYLFSLFYAGTIKGSGLVFGFLVGVAIMVLVNSLIRHLLPRRKSLGQGQSTGEVGVGASQPSSLLSRP